MHKRIICTCLLLGLFLSAYAQPGSTPQKPLRVGIGLMGASYVGDLNTDGDVLHRFYPGVSVSLQFAGQKLIAPQLNTGFGKFVAQDRNLTAVDGVSPNTFVDTPFFFADFRLRARFLRDKGFSPYVSAGVGLFGYTPKDQDGNNLLDNIASRNEGETYGSITVAFPLSAGFELRMSHILSLGLEYTYRVTGSDYLDNIGQLGLRDGKDKVQSLLVSVYVTFDPEHPINFNNMRGRDRK